MGERGLSERKKLILKAIIDAHIAYGEPVGSKFLANDKQLACSSATIRNEMAELEALGYLEQPHTSAGRVPSEQGYRFYVDSLLDDYSRTRYEIEKINLSLKSKLTELDQILAEASKIAASVTNYTALALKSRSTSLTVSRFECVYLDSHSFLLVMLIGNAAKTKTIHLSFRISQSSLERLSYLLNRSFVNVTADEMLLSQIMELEEEMGAEAAIVTPIIKAIHETLKEQDGGEVKLEGINRLLQYPEYSDASEFREMLGALEQKEDILNIVAGAKDDDINIVLGSESSVKVMNHSALVFKPITTKDGKTLGAIGVLGPLRMDYQKVLATISGLSGRLADMINENTLTDGENSNDNRRK